MDRDEVKRKAAAEASLAKAEEHTKNHRRMTATECADACTAKPVGKPADMRWQDGHHTAYGYHPADCDCGNHPRPITGLEIRHREEANKKRVAEFHAQKEADIIVPLFAHALAAEGHREAQLVDPLYTEIRRLQLIISSEIDTIHEELEEVWDGMLPDEPEQTPREASRLLTKEELAELEDYTGHVILGDIRAKADEYEDDILSLPRPLTEVELDIRVKADEARDAVMNDPSEETHRAYAEVMEELGEATDQPEYGRGPIEQIDAELAEALARRLDREILAAEGIDSMSDDGFPLSHEEVLERYAAKKDPVNSPAHYNQFGLECIDAIELTVGEEGFIGYCQGNAMKYLWRANYKGNKQEDLAKAAWYTRMASGDDPRE